METAVFGFFNIAGSELLSDQQKDILFLKLANRINKEGVLFVKSQKHRSQLANKEEVIEQMNNLIKKALEKKKKRVATKASKASKEKRLEAKKKKAETKSGRRKIDHRGL